MVKINPKGVNHSSPPNTDHVKLRPTTPKLGAVTPESSEAAKTPPQQDKDNAKSTSNIPIVNSEGLSPHEKQSAPSHDAATAPVLRPQMP
mmetsp:Transcript_24372/g.37073  ORF Transcript_24372/g.37073 Transcript_24372/m.37073 type:complete len:90 (-) Transcript_24372:2233-2502(-)